MSVLRRLRLWARWRRFDAGLREELEFHRSEIQRALEQQGISTRDAARASRRRMGNMALTCDDARDIWVWRWLDRTAQDVRLALRTIRCAPGFSAAVVATLAVGIGSVSAVFTLADPIIFRPLPYRDADRIVAFDVTGKGAPFPRYGDLAMIQNGSHTLQDLSTAAVATGADAYRDGTAITYGAVSPHFFDLIGAHAAAGRLFTGDEYPKSSHDRPDVAVLTWGFWQRAFGGPRGIIGRTVRLAGSDRMYRVVGVLSPDFMYPNSANRPPDYIIPDRIEWERAANPYIGPAYPIAKLRPGVTMEQADVETQMLFVRSERQNPKYPQGRRARVMPLQQDLFGDVRTPLLMLFGAALCLLLLACANLAHLTAARLTSQTRELVVRHALGGSKARLISQLLTCAAPLAIAGGALGLAIGHTLFTWGIGQTPEFGYLYPRRPAHLTGRVVAATMLLTVGAFVLVAIVPALGAVRGDLRPLLSQHPGRVRRGWMPPDAIVTALQTGFAVAVVVVSVLIVRSFVVLEHAPRGVQPFGLLTIHVPLPADTPHPLTIRRQVAQALAAVPGVVASSVVGGSDVPPGCNGDIFDPKLAGRVPYPGGPEGVTMTVRGCHVDDRVIATEQMRLEEGRGFTNDEAYSDAPVAIVDRHAADALWPGRDPLGQTVWSPKGRARTVIGVVSTLQLNLFSREAPTGKILLPLDPNNPYELHVIRPSGYSTTSVAGLEAAVRRVDDRLRIRRVGPVVAVERATLSVARRCSIPPRRCAMTDACPSRTWVSSHG